VIVLLAMLVLIHQLLIGHVASGAGLATHTESRVKSRNLRLDLSPAARNL
jgi:hypothetical protein